MRVKDLIERLRNMDPEMEVKTAPITVFPSMEGQAPQKIPDPRYHRPVVQVAQFTEMITPEHQTVAVIGFDPETDEREREEFIN